MADGEQRTPLHYACAFAHADIARLLLESGSELEKVDSKGNTPLVSLLFSKPPELPERAMDFKPAVIARAELN
jgi:hypothetical protein